MSLSRRSLVKGAAWSVPVIAVAVSTPAAAASEPACESQYYIFDKLTEHDVAKIEVYTGEMVVVTYLKSVDLLDINIHTESGNMNYHDNNKVQAGDVLNLKLKDCEDPSFIQVHGNNTHYYGNGLFR